MRHDIPVKPAAWKGENFLSLLSLSLLVAARASCTAPGYLESSSVRDGRRRDEDDDDREGSATAYFRRKDGNGNKNSFASSSAATLQMYRANRNGDLPVFE